LECNQTVSQQLHRPTFPPHGGCATRQRDYKSFLFAVQLLAGPRSPPFREGARQALFDKSLSGAMDGGKAYAQSCCDFLVSRAFSSLEQHMGSCHFTCCRFPLLDEVAQLFLVSRR
jgi:hypothetical protein